MSNRFAQGGCRESTDGMLVWSVSVDDDDDEADDDADFDDDDDEPSISRPDLWSSRPDFGSPEWWSRT